MKPNPIEVISERIPLRQVGRRFWGLCPFHQEKTASFMVDEKGFHCFGCHAHGDAFDFLMMLDGMTFPEACRALGVNPSESRRVVLTVKKQAATLLAEWLNRQHLLVGARCRELSRQIAIANEIPDRQLTNSLTIEWEILGEIHESLARPEFAEEMWAARKTIEALTADVEPEAGC